MFSFLTDVLWKANRATGFRSKTLARWSHRAWEHSVGAAGWYEAGLRDVQR